VLADYVFWPPKIYGIVCDEQLHFASEKDLTVMQKAQMMSIKPPGHEGHEKIKVNLCVSPL
jgi:hypothetical protein